MAFLSHSLPHCMSFVNKIVDNLARCDDSPDTRDLLARMLDINSVRLVGRHLLTNWPTSY
jgi:hypothetical protein